MEVGAGLALVGRGHCTGPLAPAWVWVPRMMFRRPPKAWHQGRRDGGGPPPGAAGVKGPRWELGTLTWALPVATAQHPTWCLRTSSGHWILPFPEPPLYALESSEEVPAHLPTQHTPVHPSEPCSGPFRPVHCVGGGLGPGNSDPSSLSIRPSSRHHMLGCSTRAAVVSRGAGRVPCLTLWALQWLRLSQAGAAGAGRSAGSPRPCLHAHRVGGQAWPDKRPQSIDDRPRAGSPRGGFESVPRTGAASCLHWKPRGRRSRAGVLSPSVRPS